MACTLPTLDKTWEFHVNDTVTWSTNRYTHRRDTMLALKEALINTSDFTSPWVVESGCDSTQAINNNPATADVWAARGDLLWESDGTAHSWIVLKQTGVNSGKFQVCIDLNQNDVFEGNNVSWVFSPNAGFGATNGGTDGTTTNRPTATDERSTGSIAWVTTNTSTGSIVHVQMSSDGECTRALIARHSVVCSMLIMDVPKNPLGGTVGWTNPAFGGFGYNTSNAASYSEWNDNRYLRGRCDGNPINMYMTSLGDGSAASGQNQIVADDLGGCWEMLECGLWAPDADAPAAGRLGQIYDMRWVSTAMSVGDTLPQTGTLYQWMVVGDLAIPWNQSTPTFVTST